MVRQRMGILGRIPILRPKLTPGHSPGRLSAPADGRPTQIQVLSYGPDRLIEEDGVSVERVRELRGEEAVLWVMVEGLGTVDELRALGDLFDLHGLALEDVLNPTQRPKLDIYEDHLFVSARVGRIQAEGTTEQVSLFLGEGYVITFHEAGDDTFEGVRDRIREGRVRIRQSGPDYLAYALLDATVDSYALLLDHIGTRLEEIELAILDNFDQELLEEVHNIRRDLVGLSRFVRPLWSMVGDVIESESGLLRAETRIYLRDVHDHARQHAELVDSYREVSVGLMDLYLSLSSQRMNEVTTLLTIIATIFIPLSFIAGLYGMNFDPDVSRWNMPELGWRLGYPWALGLMVLSAGSMLLYFWRKGWFR